MRTFQKWFDEWEGAFKVTLFIMAMAFVTVVGCLVMFGDEVSETDKIQKQVDFEIIAREE